MKKIVFATLAIVTLLAIGNGAFAASYKCLVSNIDGKSVVLDCGDKTKKFTIGQEVKVKKLTKRKAVEGC